MMIERFFMCSTDCKVVLFFFWQASLGSSSPGKQPTYTNPIFQSCAVYCICIECSYDEMVFRNINSKVKLRIDM